MTCRALLPLVLATSALAGCNDPNTVLFVTNSSLGINFDSKPATASIAYDRVEGFIGPRFENGGAPPAVASMQTDGNIFNPTVRQTYATGAAAFGIAPPRPRPARNRSTASIVTPLAVETSSVSAPKATTLPRRAMRRPTRSPM